MHAFYFLLCFVVILVGSCFPTSSMILHFSLPPLPSLPEVGVILEGKASEAESAWCLPSVSQVSCLNFTLFTSHLHVNTGFGILKWI